MRSCKIYFDDTTGVHLDEIVRRANVHRESGVAKGDLGAMTVEKLLQLLADDAALLIADPDAPKAQALLALMNEHGYSVR